MKAAALLLLAAAMLRPAAASAYRPEGYPGMSWGTGTRDMTGFEGYGTQGWVRQGVQWFTLPWNIPAVTYGSYEWRVRTQNRTYYDMRGPALGAVLSKAFVDFGAEYSWREYPQLPGKETDESFEMYATWYKRYDLASLQQRPNLLGLPVVALPLSTWGRLSRDFNDLDGSGTQGFVRQAVEWYRFPGDVRLRTMASYYWRFRSRNRPYYNTQGPAIGAEVGWKPLDLGIEYVWRTYPELSKKTHDFQLYLTWYFNWDLTKLASAKR